MTFDELIAAVISDTNRPDLGPTNLGGDGQIPRAIFSATLALHTCDYFYKDIVEANTVFSAASYLQTLDTSTITRYRALAYFRKWDASSSGASGFGVGAFGDMGFGVDDSSGGVGLWRDTSSLYSTSSPLPTLNFPTISEDLAFSLIETVDLGGFFDSYGRQRRDVCYAAGTAVRINSSTPLLVGKLGYYQYPLLDMEHAGAGYTSWIAQELPFAIISAANAIIFTNTGDLDAARVLTRPSNYRAGDPGGLVTQYIATLKSTAIESIGR